ncbi:MAG: hypothetical protein RR255_05600 [Bacilli bacterium]
MKNISINDNRLIIDGFEVLFKHEIKEFVEIGEVVVVRLGIKCRDDDINNIYGVIDGKIAWRVQDMLEYNINCKPFLPDPYTAISIYKKDPGLIIANTSEGYRMLINPTNGKIVGEESWTK